MMLVGFVSSDRQGKSLYVGVVRGRTETREHESCVSHGDVLVRLLPNAKQEAVKVADEGLVSGLSKSIRLACSELNLAVEMIEVCT